MPTRAVPIRAALLGLLTVLPGCSSSEGSPDLKLPGPEAGSSTLDPDERGAFDRGSDSHLLAQHLLALADSLFQFDPTIDPAKSAEQNAAAIQTRATSQLGGCGSVTLNGSTVTANFGAPPGCTLKNGTKVSGSASLAVSSASGATTVAATFTSLVVNGKDLAGAASFVTSNGTTFTVTMSLASSGKTYSCNLTVTGSSGSMTIDGTLSSKGDTSSTTMTFTRVVWVAGQCYPSSGTLKLSLGLINETITFTSTTPATGQVQVTILKRTVTQPLPAYGQCPPTSGPG